MMIWSSLFDWMQQYDDEVVMAPNESLLSQLEQSYIDQVFSSENIVPFDWFKPRPALPMVMSQREQFMVWSEYVVCRNLCQLPKENIIWARKHTQNQILEPLLRVLLIQNFFDCGESSISIWPSIKAFIKLNRVIIENANKQLFGSLEGYSESHDSRRLILILSPLVFDCSGLDLISLLKWQFSTSASDVTPSWVTKYQPKDKVSQFWLYKTHGGNGLFMILYTKKCRFAKCFGCNLPDIGSDESFYAIDLIAQIDDLLKDSLLRQEKESVTEVFLSNNGSVFDEKTLPAGVLLYACIQLIYCLPNLNKIILETRTEYVSDQSLKQIQRTISDEKPNLQIELVIGVEIANVEWRNKHYGKALKNSHLEKLANQLSYHDMSMRCYFMYKPLVNMSDEQASEDIINGINLLENISKKTQCPITMHINPTYVAIGTELDIAYQAGKYTPPSLMDVENMLVRVGQSKISLHVGLSDEGLAVDDGYMKKLWYESKSRLTHFNMTQDFSYLQNNDLPKNKSVVSNHLIEVRNIG